LTLGSLNFFAVLITVVDLNDLVSPCPKYISFMGRPIGIIGLFNLMANLPRLVYQEGGKITSKEWALKFFAG